MGRVSMSNVDTRVVTYRVEVSTGDNESPSVFFKSYNPELLVEVCDKVMFTSVRKGIKLLPPKGGTPFRDKQHPNLWAYSFIVGWKSSPSDTAWSSCDSNLEKSTLQLGRLLTLLYKGLPDIYLRNNGIDLFYRPLLKQSLTKDGSIDPNAIVHDPNAGYQKEEPVVNRYRTASKPLVRRSFDEDIKAFGQSFAAIYQQVASGRDSRNSSVSDELLARRLEDNRAALKALGINTDAEE